MQTVAEIQEAIRKLTPAELEELREFVEQVVEDQLELTPEFQASIERGERDIANGRVRVRHIVIPAG